MRLQVEALIWTLTLATITTNLYGWHNASKIFVIAALAVSTLWLTLSLSRR